MSVMDIGVFQLLPRGRAATDREVVEQALWEVDFAERHGFESVWITEHHFSGYGSIGVPSGSCSLPTRTGLPTTSPARPPPSPRRSTGRHRPTSRCAKRARKGCGF